jgi:hypothetical protein
VDEFINIRGLHKRIATLMIGEDSLESHGAQSVTKILTVEHLRDVSLTTTHQAKEYCN